MTRGEYLQRADDCEKLARLNTMASVKHMLLRSAATWRRLAAAASDDGAESPAGPDIRRT
jgi:hypothetical protein